MKQLIAFVKKSPENRTQAVVFAGFVVVPVVGMLILLGVMFAGL